MKTILRHVIIARKVYRHINPRFTLRSASSYYEQKKPTIYIKSPTNYHRQRKLTELGAIIKGKGLRILLWNLCFRLRVLLELEQQESQAL